MALKVTDKELEGLKKIHKDKLTNDFPEVMELIQAQERKVKRLDKTVKGQQTQLVKLNTSIEELKSSIMVMARAIKYLQGDK